MNDITVWIALGAGFASFISPCCLPLYPSYLSYITGISVTEIKESKTKEVRLRTMYHTLFFILGFSIVYYTLGYGTNVFADFFSENRLLIQQIAGIFIVLMGLMLIGLFQPTFLMKDRRFNLIPKKANFISSFLFGIGFSAGWTPCTGPALAAILALSATEPGAWFKLTTAYALGFAIPFFIMAFFLGSAKWIIKYSSLVMKIGGAIMILMGMLVFTDQMYKITIWLNDITPGWLQF